MPKNLEQDGFTFFFYMNEHLPVHVHVMRQGKKAKLEIVGGKDCLGKQRAHRGQVA